jgi:hypothetical protein
MSVMGVAGNLAAILVICRSRRLLSSPFNQILTCNLAFHSAYLVANVLTEVRELNLGEGEMGKSYYEWEESIACM